MKHKVKVTVIDKNCIRIYRNNSVKILHQELVHAIT